MNDRIVDVIRVVSELPEWIPAAVICIVVVACIAAYFGVRRRKLIRAATELYRTGQNDSRITEKLLSRPGLVESLIRREGDGIVSHFELGKHFVQGLERRHRSRDAVRALKLAPHESLFTVFSLSLIRDSIASVLTDWMEENKEFGYLKSLALAARGRPFNGKKGLQVLKGRIEEIRELSGDPEWSVRFFTLEILLADEGAKTLRLLKESFSDPHPLIRRTVASRLVTDDYDFLFGALMNLVLDDPVPEVRKAARERIDSDFPSRWKLDPAGMNALQAVHVLELLKLGSLEDENVAVNALLGDSVEARLAAARFLNRSGSLDKVFSTADRGDRDDWERRLLILSHAAGVGITGFLDVLKTEHSVSVLLLGARLLQENGNPSLIASVAERAFLPKDPVRDADGEELYRCTVALCCTRGDEKSRKLLRDELLRRKEDPDVLGFILPLLPPGEASVFRDVLLEFLVDPSFPADEAFLLILESLPPSMFLGRILDILESDRSTYEHSIRLRALRCLGNWNLEQTLQIMLENLPILNLEQARDFSTCLAAMDAKRLNERATFILSSPDSGLRAALISCLPQKSLTYFRKIVTEGMADTDPEVRIACFRALIGTGELKSDNRAIAMLQDPVEHVRREVARIAGSESLPKFIARLDGISRDSEETRAVRSAAIEGLAAGKSKESLNALVKQLMENTEMESVVRKALLGKTDRKSILVLIDHFKDAEALTRDAIASIFTDMGELGDDSLVALLKEGIPSLHSFLSDILTKTGFVETLIRRLGHRKPEIRREAAGLLADIATEPAYRGIVLAAKDPDKEVRVRVTKALEALATPESSAILEGLQEDPDKKVRKYTLWAMERIKSKNLP